MARTLLILGHGSGRPLTADQMFLPHGVSIVTYNHQKGPMCSPEIKAIANSLAAGHEAPQEIGGYQRTEIEGQYPNYPIIFSDRNELEKAIARSLGVYEAGTRGLRQLDAQRWNGEDSSVDQIVRSYVVDGFKQFILLTCRDGPSLRVLGEHDTPGDCRDAYTELRVGTKYDIISENLPCMSCSRDLLPTKINMKSVKYRIEAKVRPHFRETVTLVPGVAVGDWVRSGEEVEISIPRATIKLELETREV